MAAIKGSISVSAIWKLKHRGLLMTVVLVLPACSAIGPFSEYEKSLINRPLPKDVSQAKLECNIRRAHYDMLLFTIKQRDENGWDDDAEKDVMISDAWADYHRARRIGCSGWE